MKKASKTLSIFLAMALTMGLATPAIAAKSSAIPPPITSVAPHTDNTYSGNSANQQTGTLDETQGQGHAANFVGVINPTMIKATIPTTVTFDIDPTLDLATTTNPCYDQVTEPTNIQIVNSSKVPVYAYVTKVAGSANIKLTKTAGDLNVEANKRFVMFGLTTTDATMTALTAANWMYGGTSATWGFGVIPTSTNNGKYYFDGESTCTAIGVSNAGAPTANVKTLHIIAATTEGWKAGDIFTIQPTIVISVKDPNAAAGSTTAIPQPTLGL